MFAQKSAGAAPWWLPVAAIAFLASCAVIPTNPPSLPSPTLSGQASSNWHIRFKVSGGIVGLRRTVELDGTGQLIVVDERAARQVRAQAPEQERAALAASLKAAKVLQPTGRPPVCPDCFEYELDAQIEGKQVSARLTDRTLSGSGVEGLITLLMNLQERALAGKLKP